MIPTNISRDDILRAIEEIDRNGVPDTRSSHDYYLSFNGKDYPPKYVVSIANKFINGNELDPKEFGGGEESNGFLRSRGFEIIASDDVPDSSEQKSDFAGSLKRFLEASYSIEVTKYRNHLTLPSGTSIHLRGSKILPGDRGFYYLLEEDYNDTINSPNRYLSIVFGTVENTFVLPPEKLREVFEGEPLTRSDESNARWYFDVTMSNNKHYLKLATGSKTQYEIDGYLNKWEQIPELAKSGSINSKSNYWIFVVTNKESLSATEVYKTRMSENFWGLNERTQLRRYLKKGDKVIFSHGAKSFMGTATLDSDSFELDENQKVKFSHGEFKTDYGVILSNIIIWEEHKKIGDYADYISFIKNKDQYSYYFQGGVKKISKSDYEMITKNSSPNQNTITKEISIWLVRAGDKGQGEQIALEKNLVGIGYGGLSGLDQINDFKNFKEHFSRTHPNDSPYRVGQVTPQIWNFMKNIKPGDLVVLPLKTKHSKEIAVGQIVGSYINQNLNPEIKIFRPVKWFKKDIPRNEFDPEVTKSLDVQGTVFKIGGLTEVNRVKAMLQKLGIDTAGISESLFEDETSDPANAIPLDDSRSWLSLAEQEIHGVIDRVLNGQGRRLEIEPAVLYRIISHLILSKHVILVGAPGTGKTDLARRMLRELGVLLGKLEPIERVASYEWGRYEVIGGMSLTPDSAGNLFHLGCVTHAIKEEKLLLIDEFNRADMNKAFGEMFLAVDHGVIQLKEGENPLGFKYKSPNEIEIPTNFRMICTMNDYDKSLLNELSYGLLRRFAFVTIDIPNDAKKVKEITIERAKNDLDELDELQLEKSIFKIEKIIDKFIEFLFAIKEKRQIGISSYIDVIKYLLYGVTKTSNNPWGIMNSALIDYIIPQFDRLDFDTLDFAYKYAQISFRDDNATIPELKPFLNALNEKVRILQNLNKLFSSETE